MDDSFTFTVGKLDAGMAILLGERAHLIEFPSILLPPGTTTGSIVNISVSQNRAQEKKRDDHFWSLQEDILRVFGTELPQPPELRVRNVTQTSVTLEWSALQLATARIRSLDIYRNGSRLAAIPSPLTNLSTKLSGLELDTEYTFQLVLRTTAGTLPSPIISLHTHTMQDTSGIVVCFGAVPNSDLLQRTKDALEEMGARWSEKIQIDTSHYVCSTPVLTDPGAQAVGPQALVNFAKHLGAEYQRALQLSIPTVQPSWVLACKKEGRMIPVGGHYLGTTPHVAPTIPGYTSKRTQSTSDVRPITASTTTVDKVQNRASMPPSLSLPPSTTSFREQDPIKEDPIPEDPEHDDAAVEERLTSTESKRKSRSGTMNKDFKFPPPSASPSPSPAPSPIPGPHPDNAPDRIISPASIEVPAPPVVDKELHDTGEGDGDTDDDEEGGDDVGDTVEIEL